MSGFGHKPGSMGAGGEVSGPLRAAGWLRAVPTDTRILPDAYDGPLNWEISIMGSNARKFVSTFVWTLLLMSSVRVWAGPPPDPTASDGNLNTAGGTSVLSNNTGKYNTGFGAGVLT